MSCGDDTLLTSKWLLLDWCLVAKSALNLAILAQVHGELQGPSDGGHLRYKPLGLVVDFDLAHHVVKLLKQLFEYHLVVGLDEL